MRCSRSLTLLLASAATHTEAGPFSRSNPPNESGIQWMSCQIPNATVPLECGSLTVPLDYTNKTSNDTLQLQLQRAPAAKNSTGSKSILLNFGGPGADGIEDFAYFARRMQAATGDGHHLINIVPRGTGTTLPFSCFANDLLRSSSTQALAGNASNVSLGYVWNKGMFFSASCQAAQNKTGNFIGTAFVVRDMMSVVDALAEDGMLRYWGVSYGSILGATAVAMFPDKVDRVILDGVANPFEYYENRETELFTSTDDVLAGFVTGCLAAPDSCVLAKNQTAPELEESIFQLLQKLKYDPVAIPVPGVPGGGILLDYSLVSAQIFRQLYTPAIWPNTAKCIDALMMANITNPDLQHCVPGLSADSAAASDNTTSTKKDQEAQQGIKCGDVRTHTTNLTAMMPVFEGRHNKSRFFGDYADIIPAQCAQWMLPAKERYMGDFNVTPKNPVLLIGNTHDPATPLVSARNVSETFKGSVLLQHDAYGHDSLMQGSLCTAKAIRSYFVNGTLPQKGTKCPVEVPLFSGKEGWDEVITALEASN